MNVKRFVHSKKIPIMAVALASVVCVGLAVQCNTAAYTKIPKLEMPKVGGADIDAAKVILDASVMENAQNSLPVYQLQEVNAIEECSKISRLFGVSTSEIGGFPEGHTTADGTGIGLDYETGRWFYTEGIDFNQTGEAPSDAEAIAIARQFIAENDLYPMEELGEPHIGETYTGSELEGNKHVLQKDVYFYPTVDGKKVYGNFRIGISVGADGKIVGVDKFACSYELAEQTAAKDMDEVQTALNEKDYTLVADVAPNTLTVDTVSDAFYADPESGYIQPIYVLEAEDTPQCSILMDASKE